MKKMRKVLAGVLAGALVLSFAACGDSSAESASSAPAKEESAAAASSKSEAAPAETETKSESAPAESTGDKKFKIGFSVPNVDDYCQQVMDAWQAECDKLGIELMISNAEYSLEKQVSQVEDMVAAGCDFIAARALDSEGLIKAAEYCKEHGVPIAGCEFDIASDACATHFLFPETGVGEGAGQAVVKLLEENPDLTLKMGHIWVNSSVAPEHERWDGFTSQFQDYIDSGRVEVVDTQESLNDSGAAMTIAENWLTSKPEINCIFGNNDAMAYAAAGIVASNGKKMNEEYWVFGVGGDADGFTGIREGVMYSTSLSTDMAERQYHWVDIIYDYLANGVELEESYSWSTPATSITSDNVDDFPGH